MWPLLFLAVILLDGPSTDPAAHRAEWEAWRSRRLESLRRDDGWLTLVGLFWLQPGENPVGSSKSSRVLLPASSPARLGTLLLENGEVTLRADPAAAVTQDGKIVENLPMKSDAQGSPTIARTGSVSFFVIRRGDRLGVRVKDTQAPARTQFPGLETFPYSETLRVEARFEAYDPPKSIPVPNVLGATESEQSPGALVFELQGKTYRLDPVLEAGERDLFVIFGDSTNGVDTYGGGRFLYASPPVDGKTVLDFNKAYNPPCVFTPYATCPLPPVQNRLTTRIAAGEKIYEH